MNKKIQVPAKRRIGKDNERKIRILHVINTLSIGGAENYVVNLANSLDKSRFQAWIAYCDGKTLGIDGEALTERLNSEVGLVKFNLRKIGSLLRIHDLFYNFFYNFGTVFVLYKIIKRYKIDLVHTHLMASALGAWVAAKIAGVPVIYNLMGVHSPQLRLEWLVARHKILNRILDKLVGRYIAFSEFLKKDLKNKRGISSKKIELIYFSVDLVKYSTHQGGNQIRTEFNLDDKTPVVGVIARLSPEKGVHKALKAFPYVVAELPRAKLLIVGDGPLRGQLEAMSKALNVSSNVIFTGFRHDIAELLKVVDLYLQVGDKPNIGTTTLEAMALAKPLITVAQDEEEREMAAETLLDGENGFIVNNVPQEIAVKIVYLLSDREQATKMGQRSRRIVEEKFDQQKHVKTVEELYETMIGVVYE